MAPSLMVGLQVLTALLGIPCRAAFVVALIHPIHFLPDSIAYNNLGRPSAASEAAFR